MSTPEAEEILRDIQEKHNLDRNQVWCLFKESLIKKKDAREATLELSESLAITEEQAELLIDQLLYERAMVCETA